MKINQTKDGLIIQVYIKPNSPKFKIALDEDEGVIFCTQEPEKGKANKEIVKGLSKLLHAHVEIASGFTSKQKQLLIRGIEKADLEQFFQSK